MDPKCSERDEEDQTTAWIHKKREREREKEAERGKEGFRGVRVLYLDPKYPRRRNYARTQMGDPNPTPASNVRLEVEVAGEPHRCRGCIHRDTRRVPDCYVYDVSYHTKSSAPATDIETVITLWHAPIGELHSSLDRKKN